MFLYIENAVTMAYGYFFWFILSRITTADVIGISSSLISISTIFVALSCVGIPLGSQRFLGKLFMENRLEDAKVVIFDSLLLVTVGVTICAGLLIVTSEWSLYRYDINLVIITVVLIATSSISTQFRYIVIASLDTGKLVTISIISSGIKLLSTVFLVLEGTNELGLMIGFTVAPFLSSVLFGFHVRRLLKGQHLDFNRKLTKTIKMLLKASVVSWIPFAMDTIGAQMGTILVLGIQGSADAGIYFIAFQITVGVSAVIWALESVAYPALSSMNEGKRLFLWRVIKIGSIIVLPLSSSIIFYSEDIMQIFGYHYIKGTYSLQILLLSILPNAVTIGINILAYSRGNYGQVLIIGLATTIPRTVLYFLFIPWYGGSGAALSFTFGSLFGLVVSLIIARRLDVFISWKQLCLIFTVPFALGLVLSMFDIHFVIALSVSVVLSYLVLLKFKTIDRNDVTDSMSVFPQKIAGPFTRAIITIGVKLNKNY